MADMSSSSAQVDLGLEGDVSTFGKSLDAFGFSTLNPNHLQNSCVSVTLAKLLAFRDVHHFWQDTIGGDLPDRELTMDDIQDLLRRTRWGFKWRKYKSEAGKSAYSLLKKDMHTYEPETGLLWGTLYSQGSRPGHCAVSAPLANIGSFPGPTANSLNFLQFVCYQSDTYGVDVEHEVRTADNLLMFVLYCPREDAEWKEYLDRSFWRMIERRQDPLWQRRWLETINRHLTVLGLEPICTFPRPVTELATRRGFRELS